CAHLQPVLPQQQVLNEIPGETPGPERQAAIADRVEAELAHLVDEEIGADKIVAPILEEGRDAQIVFLAAKAIKRPRRADQQGPSGLEHSPASRKPGVQVLGVADRLE